MHLAAVLVVWAAGAPGAAAELPEALESGVPDDLAAGAAAYAGPDTAPGDPAGLAPPVPRYASEIERTWFAPAIDLEERVSATRRTSLEYGVWNFDAAARAIAYGSFPVTPLERARAAVRLAPDLPSARMDLARATWLEEEAPLTALRLAWSAAPAVARHFEASLWFAGTGLVVLMAGLVGGGLLTLAWAGILAAPHAAHDLGDLVSTSMPPFGRAALFGALLLLPLVLGAGLLGVSLVLLGIGVAYGTRGQRIALLLAGGAVVLGLYPVAQWAGAVLAASSDDPVAEAAYSVASGSALGMDLVRLSAAADADPLAARALARRARRTRSLSAADAHYQALLEQEPDDYVIANNAANVRLNLGHMEMSLDLYGRAAGMRESAIVLYNLAQAYGRAFQVDKLAEMISRAQALDGMLLSELTHLQGTDPEGFVVDLPLPVDLMWRRVLRSAGGEPVARELRAAVAPGVLGSDVRVTAGAFLGALLLPWLLAGRFRPSRFCSRCGRRLCSRCDPKFGGGHLCGACVRLFYRPEDTDRALRSDRVAALRLRELRVEKLVWGVSIAVPGVAGLLARRPLRALLSSGLFALAVAAVVWRNGFLPDPLVAGAAAPFLWLHVAGLAGLLYAGILGSCLAARRRL